MSKEIPTPYIWTFQPQMGTAAGASQDYSTRMNWFSAGPDMINDVNNIRDTQNRILMTQSAMTATPRNLIDPRIWPAHLIKQPVVGTTHVEMPRNEVLEQHLTSQGAQIAGGGPALRSYKSTSAGEGFTSFSASCMRPDGVFQLGGGSRSSFNPLRTDFAFHALPSEARYGGIGSRQFVEEFVPAVYLNPYSGPPDSYPDQFIRHYNVYTNSVSGYS
ncbi:pVIII [Deer mastadenovirus B]|uniref:Pre-hexon-linking protein VIII n=1 Tax=Deer mastadenovirus B TaxID=2170000 RepID=A0A1Y0B6H2_9ADEN|nr:pVIII [Deer mastadenovirus B]ART33377.1 pVIII [Deer mastadenovirus B]